MFLFSFYSSFLICSFPLFLFSSFSLFVLFSSLNLTSSIYTSHYRRKWY
jgi:hypothetical protein